MHPEIRHYNEQQSPAHQAVCDRLAETMQRWLWKAQTTQWGYRNLVRRKGKLERLK